MDRMTEFSPEYKLNTKRANEYWKALGNSQVKNAFKYKVYIFDK